VGTKGSNPQKKERRGQIFARKGKTSANRGGESGLRKKNRRSKKRGGVCGSGKETPEKKSLEKKKGRSLEQEKKAIRKTREKRGEGKIKKKFLFLRKMLDSQGT